MYLLRYALRNALRHPERSLVTLFAVVVAVSLVVFGHTLLCGLKAHVVKEFVRQTGHVRLRNPAYEREARFEPLEHDLAGWRALRARLLAVEGVGEVRSRLHLRLLVQFTDESTILTGPEAEAIPEEQLSDDQIFGRKAVELAPALAFEPDAERGPQNLERRVVAGAWFTAPDAAEVLLGSELAARLGARPGDEVQLVAYRQGMSDAAARVVGIIAFGNRLTDRLAYMPLGLAETLLGLEDRTTELLVFGDRGAGIDQAAPLRERLAAAGLTAGLDARIWAEIGVARLSASIFDFILSVLLVMIIGVAGVGLLNTMLMSVLERRKEIGVLLALGMNRSRIVRVFLLEAGAFGLVGAVIGLGTGVLGSLYLVEHGIRLGAGTTRRMLVAMGDTIHGVLTVEGLLTGLAVGLVVAFVGACWPAYRAASMHPIDALRRS